MNRRGEIMMSELQEINQDILNSIEESKNRLRRLGEEIKFIHIPSQQSLELVLRIQQALEIEDQNETTTGWNPVVVSFLHSVMKNLSIDGIYSSFISRNNPMH